MKPKSNLKPILFNTDMVTALLNGTKAVTRRPLKPYNPIKSTRMGGYKQGDGLWVEKTDDITYVKDYSFSTCWYSLNEYIKRCSKYQIGDVLYVRETWKCHCARRFDANVDILYKAGGKPKRIEFANGNIDLANRDDYDVFISKWFNHDKWIPSLHMPKELARIFLKITDVRLEPLQNITNDQAKTEGVNHLYDDLSDAEYDRWSKAVHITTPKDQQHYRNYLWHGNFGKYGTGNKVSDNWPYQQSGYDDPKDSFSSLWNSTVPLKDWETYGWNANPYVWVIEFEPLTEDEIKQLLTNN